MKQHLEDDDLILHFYGETGSAAEPHLIRLRRLPGSISGSAAGAERG